MNTLYSRLISWLANHLAFSRTKMKTYGVWNWNNIVASNYTPLIILSAVNRQFNIWFCYLKTNYGRHSQGLLSPAPLPSGHQHNPGILWYCFYYEMKHGRREKYGRLQLDLQLIRARSRYSNWQCKNFYRKPHLDGEHRSDIIFHKLWHPQVCEQPSWNFRALIFPSNASAKTSNSSTYQSSLTIALKFAQEGNNRRWGQRM